MVLPRLGICLFALLCRIFSTIWILTENSMLSSGGLELFSKCCLCIPTELLGACCFLFPPDPHSDLHSAFSNLQVLSSLYGLLLLSAPIAPIFWMWLGFFLLRHCLREKLISSMISHY
jgi:hypothetical protein